MEENGQTCWCSRDQQRACRMAHASAEKLEHTRPAERERVASVPQQKPVGKYAGAALAKRKTNRAVCTEYQIMRGNKFKVGKREGIRERALGGKGGLHRERRQTPKS